MKFSNTLFFHPLSPNPPDPLKFKKRPSHTYFEMNFFKTSDLPTYRPTFQKQQIRKSL